MGAGQLHSLNAVRSNQLSHEQIAVVIQVIDKFGTYAKQGVHMASDSRKIQKGDIFAL